MLLKTGRRKVAPGAENVATSGLSGWQVLAEAGGRRVAVDGPGLRATARGLGVVDTDEPASTLKSWPWNRVLEIRVGSPHAGTDGIQRRLLELRVDGGQHLFMCTDDALAEFGFSLERHAPEIFSSLVAARARRIRVLATAGAEPGRVPASAEASSGIASTVRNLASIIANRWQAGLRQRLAPIGAGIGALALIGGGLMAGTATLGGAAPIASRAQGDPPRSSIMARMEHQYDSVQTVNLPAATSAPAPAPPSLAGAAPLKPHEIFGFAPYWTLPEASGFELDDLTTIAYFSVDVNADGSIDRSGPGWSGYESQDLSDLITAAHGAGDRVVLTATCFDQSTLNSLTSNPSAASTLASSLVQLVQAKNLDGVNLDFEGQGPEDQVGLDHLVAQVSQILDAADPHYQLTMDTYASSAADPGGFYDIPGLTPYVDAFFVMGYDMDDPSTPSPTAALSGPSFNDSDALSQYTSVVPASKVILGVPYYGYDWPTSGPAQGDAATGQPTPVSYSQVVSEDHPVYWDAVTQTPWSSYEVGSQWHQIWFDDPTSLALKADLASSYQIAGVGVWALGMDGNDPAMIAALMGDAPTVKDYSPAPSGGGLQAASVAASTTTPASPAAATPEPPHSPIAPSPPTTTTTTAPTTIQIDGYKYTGVWDGKPVSLSASPPGIEPLTTGQPVGQMTGFSTNNPEYTCLESASSLPVYAEVGADGTYEVKTSTPSNCAKGTWQFSGPSPSGTSAPAQNSTGNSAGAATGTSEAGSQNGSAGSTFSSMRATQRSVPRPLRAA